MKNALALLLLLVFSITLNAQDLNIKKFYRHYKKYDNTTNFVVPGFLIRLGTGIARDMVKTDEEYEMLHLLRSVRKLRILVSEDDNPVSKEDFNGLIKNVRNAAFDDLISVRDEETNVQIMVKENGKKITGIFILVSDEGEFMMLHMKTRLKYKDINRIIKMFDEKIPLKKETPKEEPTIPQV